MHYFLFNNDVFVSNGKVMERLPAGTEGKFDFHSVTQAKVCMVDVDVLVTAAPDNVPEQKDALLAKAFTDRVEGQYVIQDERIGLNMYQVVGASTEKVREIYKLLPGDRIVTFVPYAYAIRALLSQKEIDPRTIVAFVDDLQGETLLTFFEGLRFSKTRRLSETEPARILPEIKRSAIGFTKEIRRDNDPYVIATNNSSWIEDFKRMLPNEDCLNIGSEFSAIEGLKSAQFPGKFELPEEIIRRIKHKERQARIPYLAVSIALSAAGLVFFLYWWGSLTVLKAGLTQSTKIRDQYEMRLTQLDKNIYLDALKKQKTTNFGDVYLLLRAMIPVSYEIAAMDLSAQSGRWVMDVVLVVRAGEFLEDFSFKSPFNRAKVQDVFVKERPGKQIRIEL